MSYDVASGQRQTVVRVARSVGRELRLRTDGRSILFTAQDRGVVNVYSVGYPSGTPRVVTKGGAIAGLEAGRDFAVIARNTMTSPTELFRVSLSGGDVKPLTRENEAWLKDVAFSAPESLTVTGAAGAQVQYWLIKPPNFDAAKKVPGGLPDSWRPAGRVGRRVVVALESRAVGGAGLGGGGAESARLDRASVRSSSTRSRRTGAAR